MIYDRIRENLKKYRKMPLPELLDLSVNETLSRTVVTSSSVLITLLALLLLGPDVIFGFTAAITPSASSSAPTARSTCRRRS